MQNAARERLWTRDFVLITLVNLFTFTGFYFLLPTLPRFVLDVLHGDKADVGYVMGIYTTAAVLVRPAVGYLLDTAGRRREGIGYYGLSTTVGMATGPALGLLILGEGGFERLFVAATSCAWSTPASSSWSTPWC